MGEFTKLAQKVISVARGDEKKKPSPYDTKAVVNRIDYTEKKAYVRFYGGIDETPVDLTINCSRGDTVQVRVGGGRAWLTGNLTAPPTDDKAVNILNHTVNNLRNQLDKTKEELEEEIEEIEPGEGKVIERIATEYILSELNYLVDDEVIPYEPTPGEPMEWSEELPEWVPSPRTYFWKRTVIYYTDGTVDIQDPILDANAQISAEADYAISSENNYFWHDSTGAWVTEVEREDYIDDPTHGGYASRVTNAGILQTYNGNLLTSWTGSGVSFYDGSDPTASGSKTLAAFHSTGITFDTTTPFTIGNTTGQNPSYIRWINTGTDLSPNWKLQINADTIQFGSDSTDISDVVNPYEIETSVESVVANTDSGTTTPTSVTVYLKKAGSFTSGYLYVEKTTNGTSWSQHYGPSQSASFTVPLSSSSSIKFYRFSWYEESAMTNLKNSKTIPVIATGEEGTGIDDTTITYATSSSYSTPPSSGWQSTLPYVSQGYYLWTKTIFSYSDGTSSDPVYSVARQGVNGQDGTDGEDFLYNQYMDFNSNTEPKGLKIYAGNKATATYAKTYSLIKNDGFHIFVNNTNNVSQEQASFLSNTIDLGKASTEAKINLCNNAFFMKGVLSEPTVSANGSYMTIGNNYTSSSSTGSGTGKGFVITTQTETEAASSSWQSYPMAQIGVMKDYNSSVSPTNFAAANMVAMANGFRTNISIFQDQINLLNHINSSQTSGQSLTIDNTNGLIFSSYNSTLGGYLACMSCSKTGYLDVTGGYRKNGVSFLSRTLISKDNISISSGSTTSGQISISSSDQNDYILFGVLGWDLSNASSSGVGSSKVIPMAIGWYSDSQVQYQLSNTGSSAAKVKLSVRVLLRAI